MFSPPPSVSCGGICVGQALERWLMLCHTNLCSSGAAVQDRLWRDAYVLTASICIPGRCLPRTGFGVMPNVLTTSVCVLRRHMCRTRSVVMPNVLPTPIYILQGHLCRTNSGVLPNAFGTSVCTSGGVCSGQALEDACCFLAHQFVSCGDVCVGQTLEGCLMFSPHPSVFCGGVCAGRAL